MLSNVVGLQSLHWDRELYIYKVVWYSTEDINFDILHVRKSNFLAIKSKF